MASRLDVKLLMKRRRMTQLLTLKTEETRLRAVLAELPQAQSPAERKRWRDWARRRDRLLKSVADKLGYRYTSIYDEVIRAQAVLSENVHRCNFVRGPGSDAYSSLHAITMTATPGVAEKEVGRAIVSGALRPFRELERDVWTNSIRIEVT